MHLVQAGASILGNGTTSSNRSSFAGTHSGSAQYELPMAVNGQGVVPGIGQNTRGSLGGGGAVSLATAIGVSGSATNNGLGSSSHSSEWREYWDDEVEASYYYNSVTGEALWVCPEGFESAVK